jgi:hypothetical protein
VILTPLHTDWYSSVPGSEMRKAIFTPELVRIVQPLEHWNRTFSLDTDTRVHRDFERSGAPRSPSLANIVYSNSHPMNPHQSPVVAR